MLVILLKKHFFVPWCLFFFSSRRRHTRFSRDWSSDVCSSDLALPNGSKIEATSRSIFGSWRQTLLIGSTTYSAKAPARFTPTPWVNAHRCRRPARQFRQRPQTTWPSPLTISPGLQSLTLEPTSTTSPTNSCPITSGTGIVALAQSSHSWMCRSVPQMPVFQTRILTSLIPGSGTGTSSTHSPRSALFFTSAFIVVFIPDPSLKGTLGQL